MDTDRYSNEDFILYFEQLEKERQEFKNKYEGNEEFKKEVDNLTQKVFNNTLKKIFLFCIIFL